MIINIKLTADEIKVAISDYILERYGIHILPKSVPLLVKSKQNYRSEWEQADIKVEGDVNCERVA